MFPPVDAGAGTTATAPVRRSAAREPLRNRCCIFPPLLAERCRRE
jgi:hypothetical protein